MKSLNRLEALTQGIIEGAFNRFFQSKKIDSSNRTETKEALLFVSHQEAQRWALRHESRQITLGEPVVTIGRALDNDIVLADPAISRYHAQLRWRERRYHLYPPVPPNGSAERSTKGTAGEGQLLPKTMVNQRPVAHQPLDSGDTIVLGRTILTVIVERGQS